MKNINDLREHLFDVIERLKDPPEEGRIDNQTAQTICLAAARLIETARVEVEFRKVSGLDLVGSPFLELKPVVQQKIGIDKTNPARRLNEKTGE